MTQKKIRSKLFIDTLRSGQKALVKCRAHGKIWEEGAGAPDTCAKCVLRWHQANGRFLDGKNL